MGENVGTAAKEEKPTEERKQSAPEWEVDWDAPAESGAKKAAANFNEAKTDAGKKIFGTDVLFGIFKTQPGNGSVSAYFVELWKYKVRNNP